MYAAFGAEATDSFVSGPSVEGPVVVAEQLLAVVVVHVLEGRRRKDERRDTTGRARSASRQPYGYANWSMIAGMVGEHRLRIALD